MSGRQPGKQVVVHCSDLHFGRGFLEPRAKQLLQEIERIQPDAVVVSGDLTMRARAHQFAAARQFLEHIHVPLLVIPGNHDVPLYNLFARFTHPFANYERYTLGLGQNPILLDGVAIYGINSVNPYRHQQGIFRQSHLREIAAWMRGLPARTWRIIVTHQHFVAIPGLLRPGAFPNAERVLSELSSGGAHAVLCGHIHCKYIGSTRDFFPHLSRPMAIVNAGTATCGRVRGADDVQVNNFVLLEFFPERFQVTPYDWTADQQAFCPGERTLFERAFFDGPPSTNP